VRKREGTPPVCIRASVTQGGEEIAISQHSAKFPNQVGEWLISSSNVNTTSETVMGSEGGRLTGRGHGVRLFSAYHPETLPCPFKNEYSIVSSERPPFRITFSGT
jgi:hypothetical protein